ncbi:phage tail assembly protein T [Moraxella equi]|uniref:Minor tail T domain-containing protein n=1 Tax=Moraxella equi TaxID=60442 RepID=A0A378QQN7_9GAMM|nr:phage tail protein [Moraxella equi]STZ03108.1 Uncharacterised protein [Moraxella equi]
MGELERTLTVAEFAEWVAYDEIDPIGSYRTDLGFALLAYLQAGDKDKSVQDFLIIDPNPMTDDDKEAFEREQHAQKAKEEVGAMIAMFNRKSS